MKIVWSLVRIFYLVDVVFLAAFVALWKGGPPPDGDFVHQFIGVIALNVCCVVIGWAVLPWPKDRKKELPATPAAPPAPPFDYRTELETLDGQESIDAFLDRRWRDRLAGMMAPRRKTPKEPHFADEWKSVATDGDFATNTLVYAEIPGTRITLTLVQSADVDVVLKACARTYGSQIGLRVDGVDNEGQTNSMPMFSPLEMVRRMRLSAGSHVLAAVVRQALNASVIAIVAKSQETPVVLVVKKA